MFYQYFILEKVQLKILLRKHIITLEKHEFSKFFSKIACKMVIIQHQKKSLDGTIMVASLYNLVTTTRGMSMTLASLKQD